VRPHRTGATALALVLTGSLLLAGCGGDDNKNDDGDDQAAQPVASGSELGQTWPLTGLDVSGDDSAAQKHPVMVVKIDNTAASAPQSGLGSADLVVEELVEGGSTRLAAFFYSDIPDEVGPVRSMRASDIGIVKPVGGTMVTSGAAAVTINRIQDAGIDFFAEGDEGFYRDDSRSAPYNLMARLDETTAAAEADEEGRPVDYLPWGVAEDLPAGQPAKTIAAGFSGGHTTNWRYDGDGYVNGNSFADPESQFPADTILVLRVQVGDAGYTDPAGNPVPETKLEGTGQAMIFHGGRLVRGTWSKDDLGSPITLSTKAGELTIPAGHTWIELIPVDGGNVTFTKK
jgi:Protein of unknown function (DUF3048) N-terminal domain/Protein of unknown function (DUF3048) C-terminal domain